MSRGPGNEMVSLSHLIALLLVISCSSQFSFPWKLVLQTLTTVQRQRDTGFFRHAREGWQPTGPVSRCGHGDILPATCSKDTVGGEGWVSPRAASRQQARLPELAPLPCRLPYSSVSKPH